MSIAWVSAAVSIFFDILQLDELNAFFEAFFATLLFYGVLKALEEEGIIAIFEELLVVSGTPLILTAYLLVLNIFVGFDGWMFAVGLPYAISGLFIFFSGVNVIRLVPFYARRAKFFAVSLILYGLHEMDYPILRPVEWFAPIGFSLGALFTILSAFAVLSLIFTEEFRSLKRTRGKVEVELKRGVMVITPKEYNELKEKLKEAPVLAFIRDIKNVPKEWDVYFVTTAKGDLKTVSPTSLAKIVELVHGYLREASKRGIGSVVLLDCLEYLLTYNDFNALAKFLSGLKDFSMLYGGTIILVTDPSAWDEREWMMLKRLLG
ncbi:hypothetical protein PAP_00960 [Palaeococcus pacificus DY20341]|uniref:DUF835 domain-containing protein n=1 Tax=Palaeococcus pacificus DY20341 TaxID=1343739 RepID=A0A075LQS1_9EURY|nr:hypothetical protein PAP_00960 [Palaeococcus pacificus DY20341]